MPNDIDGGDLEFDIECAIRYHSRRQHLFSQWHLWTQTFTVVLGSATVGMLIAKFSWPWSLIPALALTILSAVDLAVRTEQCAREHGRLRQDFLHLRAKQIEGKWGLQKLQAEKALLDAKEPPVLTIENVLAHNDTARSRGEKIYKLGLVRRTLGRFFPIGLPSKLETEKSIQL